jgi:hypothetical protein
MKADADKPRNGEQELALDESGLEGARHDLKDGAMMPACGGRGVTMWSRCSAPGGT